MPYRRAIRDLLQTSRRIGGRVEREYDLFEKFPDGSLLWRACIKGLENAIAALKEFARHSSNEHFAIHTPSKAVVARINVPDTEPPSSSA